MIRGNINDYVSLLLDCAEEQGDLHLFTFLEDGETDTNVRTAGWLAARARAIGHALAERGLAGKPALLLYAPGLAFLDALFGCFLAGVIPVPAYPPDPMRLQRSLARLRAIVADARAVAVLATQDIIHMAESARLEAVYDGPWIATDTIPDSAGLGWAPRLPGPDALAFLQYTSGSTGSPRGVMVTHGNLLSNCKMIVEAFRSPSDLCSVSWLPLYHDMGLIGIVMCCLYARRPAILFSPQHFLESPLRWLHCISRYRGTASSAPNFAYDLCVRRVERGADLGSLDLSSWRYALNGSEPVRGDVLDRFASAFAPYGFQRSAISPVYGLAEATLFVSGAHVDGTARVKTVDLTRLEQGEVFDAPEGRRLVSCGPVAAGSTVRIVASDPHIALPDDRIGEVWVSGPHVARGYWGKPELTAEVFGARLPEDERAYLRTGDLGFLDDGELFITGRQKDLIIVRGRNLAPQDLEATAGDAHEQVRPGSVAAVQVEGQDPQVIIAAELRSHANAPLRAEIRSAISASVAEAHGIAGVTICLVAKHNLPKTYSGKIQRRATLEAFLAGSLEMLDEPGGAAPQGWIMGTVGSNLQRVLGLSPDALLNGVQTFSELGLDSLQRAELRSALSGALGYELPPEALAGHLTVGDLIATLREGPVARSPSGGAQRTDASPLESRTLLSERIEPTMLRLEQARQAGTYYFETPVHELDGPWVTLAGGARKLMFATYSYLGLLGHPAINDAAREAILRYGTGTHGVRLNGGTLDLHRKLEARIATFMGREAAIVFSSGYMTNASTLATLVQPGDWVFCDQYNHASIVDGCRASGGVFRVFPHAALDELERQLTDAPRTVLRLVVADAVFSMDGDLLDLPRAVELCRRHGALLMVDEAHSLGVIGPGGRGIEAHFGMSGSVDICMGTLSKAIPAVGGFVASSRRVVDFLRFSARGYIFSAAMPPPRRGGGPRRLRCPRDRGGGATGPARRERGVSPWGAARCRIRHRTHDHSHHPPHGGERGPRDGHDPALSGAGALRHAGASTCGSRGSLPTAAQRHREPSAGGPGTRACDPHRGARAPSGSATTAERSSGVIDVTRVSQHQRSPAPLSQDARRVTPDPASQSTRGEAQGSELP